MTLFTSNIANYFGHGNTRTDYSDGGFSWNVLCLNLGKYKARVIQDRKVVTNKVKPKGMVYTTDVEIYGVKKYKEGESIVNDLCRLLSLASFSQVVPFCYTFSGEGRQINIYAEAMKFRPLIAINDGDTVHAYIEKTWTPYRKLKRIRKLAEVIEMLTIAELPAQPLEVKLALIFIVLENLKGTYAKQSGIPFCKGYFRDHTTNNKPLEEQPRLSIKTLLMLMFKGVGMKPSLRRILKLRNEIIHFGLSRKPYSSLSKDYDYCQDIVREYLLRLLNYKGKYLIYSKASRSTSCLW